jgi:hypothetical protein
MKVYLNNGEFFMDDNGNVVQLTPNEDNYLKLPENSCKRQWVSGSKVEKAPGQCVDYGTDVKEARVLGPKTSSTPKTSTKGWMEYLTDEEKTIIEEIKAKAEKRAKKAQLIAQIEEWTKKMEELGDEE